MSWEINFYFVEQMNEPNLLIKFFLKTAMLFFDNPLSFSYIYRVPIKNIWPPAKIFIIHCKSVIFNETSTTMFLFISQMQVFLSNFDLSKARYLFKKIDLKAFFFFCTKNKNSQKYSENIRKRNKTRPKVGLIGQMQQQERKTILSVTSWLLQKISGQLNQYRG